MSRNPFARFKFTTNAVKLYIKANPTKYSVSTLTYLRLNIDGAISLMHFTSDTYQVLNLEAGDKTIEITEDSTTKPPSSAVLGVYINSIKHSPEATFTIITDAAPTNKMLFIGDSITIGQAAEPSRHSGFSMMFRDNGDAVAVYGYGYGSILQLVGDATKLNDTITKSSTLLNGTSTNKIILLLGTNDYAVDETPLATFETQYAALVDAYIAADPAIVIKCVSPLLRSTEAANSNGNTLDDFRAAISTICSTRAECTYIEGKSLLLLSDLEDGLHPSTAGHIKMYDELSLLI